MALDADQILVAGGGRVLIAPLGTTAPTDTTTAWAAGWKNLGYTTDDGVVLRPNLTVTDINAWQTFEPVRRIVTNRGLTVAFTLLQLTREALLIAFNGGTFTPGTGIVTYEPGEPGSVYERALGVEATDGTKIVRLVIPRVDISDVGDIPFTKGSATQVPLTLAMLGVSGSAPFTIIADDDAIEAVA